MNNTDDEEVNELDCYLKIIEIFEKKKCDREELEIWTYQALIKLMDDLKVNKNYIRIKNSIILLRTLFSNNPPDLYTNLGIDINSISKKKPVISILRQEFLLD